MENLNTLENQFGVGKAEFSTGIVYNKFNSTQTNCNNRKL